MKSIQLAVLPVALTMVLSGCNGSGSGSSNSGEQNQPTYDVSGRVSSASVDLPMTVCADINRDWTCSAGEPSVKATQYNFTLTSTDIRVKTSPLLVQAPLWLRPAQRQRRHCIWLRPQPVKMRTR
ncbi:hypothetical protein [Photobacterium sp. Hal280]|uniref:hypothetical protein n=1 Tax=Photobacterium sp. Hal280 TaxID=3035163 RepID=UPI00301D2788